MVVALIVMSCGDSSLIPDTEQSNEPRVVEEAQESLRVDEGLIPDTEQSNGIGILETDDGSFEMIFGDFTTVSAGESHSCGVRADSTVVCWGTNYDGEADAPPGTFTAVSAGWFHSCGVRADSTVVCWGDQQ